MKTFYDILNANAGHVDLSNYCLPFYMTFSKVCHLHRLHEKHHQKDIADFLTGLPKHSLANILVMDLKMMDSCKSLKFIRSLPCRSEFAVAFKLKDLPAVDKEFFSHKADQ